MSVPRVLIAPTHRTGLPNALAALVVEDCARKSRQVRFHHLGAIGPDKSWDRWEGSAFLDPSLYGTEVLLHLYDLATRGAELSLLSADRGLFDTAPGAPWTPADVARRLDCPVVLVADCRGWGAGIGALLAGFNERMGDLNLGGVILSGVQDREHEESLLKALAPVGTRVLGSVDAGLELGWEAQAPGPVGLPLAQDLVAQAARLLDIRALEDVAGQRGFIAGAAPVGGRHDWGPLVAVAGGRGFTPWSRDSIDVLRGAGARVWRLDLSADEALPEGVAGLVVAGTLWPETLGELAANRQLMQHIRSMVHAGLPTVALGGGMLYFLRRLQDAYGRAHELAGVLPLEGEVLGEMDEPLYLQVRAQEDTVLVGTGESVTGWMLTDADIMQEVPGRAFPLEVRSPEWRKWQQEGASSPTLLCARVLMHLSSAPDAARRFVEACRRFGAAH